MNSLYDIVNISKEHDWYNVIFHNCVFTATICWNYVFPFDVFGYGTPDDLKSSIMGRIGAYQIDLLHEVLGK
jgi:hypothetical protein